MASNTDSDVTADEAEFDDRRVIHQTGRRPKSKGHRAADRSRNRQPQDKTGPSAVHCGQAARTTHRQRAADHHGDQSAPFETFKGKVVTATSDTHASRQTHIGQKACTGEFTYIKIVKSSDNITTGHASTGGQEFCSGTPGAGHNPIPETQKYTDSTGSSEEDNNASAKHAGRGKRRVHKQALAVTGRQEEHHRRKKKQSKHYLTPDKIRATFYDGKSRCMWPHERPTVDQCVDAGLIFVVLEGYNDLVKCYKCNGTLCAFLPDDIPADEHRKFYPNCN